MQKKLILLSLIFMVIGSMKLVINIKGESTQCFYQTLYANQKYSVDTLPRSSSVYQVSISHLVDEVWQNIYVKEAEYSYQNLNIHKLAPASSTYSFCFKNLEKQYLRLSVQINSGLETLDFEILPDKKDSQNLEREIVWLQNPKQVLINALERAESLRAQTQSLKKVMSVRMILIAVIGLILILVVNFIFYRELKRTFKERKLI